MRFPRVAAAILALAASALAAAAGAPKDNPSDTLFATLFEYGPGGQRF